MAQRAEGTKAMAAAPGLADVQVKRADAEAIQEVGFAQAKVAEANAEAARVAGHAEGEASEARLKGEAAGLAEKAVAMKELEGVGQEYDLEVKRIEREENVRMASVAAQRDLGIKQAEAMAAALQTADIDIGISEKDRRKIAEGLSKLLADNYTLYLKTHNFHWNVTGPMFNTLHVMFMEQYTELWNALDMIAERIRALGVVAPGSFSEFAKLTVIKESEGSPSATEMIKQLVAGQEAVTKTARSIFPIVDKAGDEPTADLLTQRMQIHEKNAWMLRSLLES